MADKIKIGQTVWFSGCDYDGVQVVSFDDETACVLITTCTRSDDGDWDDTHTFQFVPTAKIRFTVEGRW